MTEALVASSVRIMCTGTDLHSNIFKVVVSRDNGVELGGSEGLSPLVMSVCSYERTLLYFLSIVLSI